MSQNLDGLAEFATTATQSAVSTRDPARFGRLAHKLHVLADKEVVKIHALLADHGIAPACHKGCDACCHRLVGATVPEVIAIADHVAATFTAEERTALRERTERLQAANAGYYAQRTTLCNAACPFLADGECLIYELRPMTCRARNSLDAGVCRAIFLEGQPGSPASLADQDELQRLNLSVIDASRAAGVMSGMYELGPTVGAALDDRTIFQGLSRNNVTLERLKVYSEFNGFHPAIHPILGNQMSDERLIEASQKFNAGEMEPLNGLLDECPGTPFERLFRLSLPHQFESEAAVIEGWERWGEALERLEEANLPPRETFELLQIFNTFSLAYTAKDVKPYLTRFMKVVHGWAAQSLPKMVAPFEAPRKPGRLRLGFISGRLAMFNGSRWSLGWLNNLSPEIETFVFNLVPFEDDTTLCFRRNADNYYHLPIPVSVVAPMIRNFDLDALIFTDIGMSGQTVQASALRLARNQFNCWGHPVTSGSPTMDYYLSSDLMEPENGQDHYTEQLVRLPGSGLTYPRRPLEPSKKTASELGVPEDGFLFFGQMPMKLTPSRDWIFEEIAARSKKPVVFVGSPITAGNAALMQRMGKPGMNTIFLPHQPQPDYQRLVELAEVSLDTPDWNGGNTTIEALTLGTPVVSLAGEFMRGRHGKAFLTQAGVPGLLAGDVRDYIELALDPDRRQVAMRDLNVDALYEDVAPARAISDFLLNRCL